MHVAGWAVRSQNIAILYDTAPAGEVSTGGLHWIREQVVTHHTGEWKEEVYRELFWDQFGTQVVFLALCNVPHPLLSLTIGFLPTPEHGTSQYVSLTGSNAVTIPPGSFCKALGSWNGLMPLPPSPLVWRFPGKAKLAEGRVGFPLRDSCSREAADTPSSYGSHPTAMAEEKRVDRFGVLYHVHFKDFAYDVWPVCQFAAHFTQSTFVCLIQFPMNIMHWTFDFSQCLSTESAQVPLQRKNNVAKFLQKMHIILWFIIKYRDIRLPEVVHVSVHFL